VNHEGSFPRKEFYEVISKILGNVTTNIALAGYEVKVFETVHDSLSERVGCQSICNCDWVTKMYLILTLWSWNFLLNFSTPCISNVNITGTKKKKVAL
jgi:hypothetical protein